MFLNFLDFKSDRKRFQIFFHGSIARAIAHFFLPKTLPTPPPLEKKVHQISVYHSLTKFKKKKERCVYRFLPRGCDMIISREYPLHTWKYLPLTLFASIDITRTATEKTISIFPGILFMKQIKSCDVQRHKVCLV